MENKRVNWIDDARGLSVFCVLLAHSCVEHPLLYTVYTPFFLTLFFFISGFLYRNVSIMDDLTKIIKHLLFPYFVLNIIILSIGVDNWKAVVGGDYVYVLNKVKYILSGYSMWFIPCLIMVQVYATLLYHISKNNFTIKVLVIIASWGSIYLIRNECNYFLPWYIDIAFISLSFFLLGNIVKCFIGYRDWISMKYRHLIPLLLIILYIVASFLLQSYFDMEFHYAYNYYHNPFLFILLSCVGIFCVCVFFQNFHFRFFNFLGKNSLTFFAFNGKARAFATILLPSVFCAENHMHAITLCFIESLILMIISFLVNIYCPFIIGKYNINK